ncbi:hypothetical protein [Paenibacillus cymbidii]|uniref:hypothetical protein n=1 Tax=Paenibacillus cymbidii TaxID=1639034 RepID=UPI001080DBB5|nr:hypothetical protein [Paenibacillus cymbidii]
MRPSFVFDPILQIEVPNLQLDWTSASDSDRAEAASYWESARDAIFARMQDLEQAIRSKQAELARSEEFAFTCQLVQEISDVAGRLLKLSQWFYWNDTEEIGLTSQV